MLQCPKLRSKSRPVLAAATGLAVAVLSPAAIAQDSASAPATVPAPAAYPTLPPETGTVPGFRPGGGPGLFIVSRSVGPRDALAPEVGSASVVRIAPEDGAFASNNPVAALSDDEVAKVSSGFGSAPSVQSLLQQPLEFLAGNDNLRTEGSSSAAGGGGVGGMVGDAVGQGMNALAGALGGLSGLNQ